MERRHRDIVNDHGTQLGAHNLGFLLERGPRGYPAKLRSCAAEITAKKNRVQDFVK